ncbi:MAG: IS1634 family transposase [Phycisphaerae bacterium]|nr:IS1634 family transposase [Phycisphaerae bacterium]
MASLTRKRIKGNTYYYARECRRVAGKPKIVRTIYLGTLERIMAGVRNTGAAPQPEAVDVASFGDVAALYDLAQSIGLVQLIDQMAPKRRQGLSTGEYLLLAAINRAVHPTSKTQLATWYRQTTLRRLLPASAGELSSQAFWNHMDNLEESHITAIEKELSRRLVVQFGLSLRTLTYDGTNFFSYLNTKNPAMLPQRGHNKQKRGDLRQVSLGLVVSTDFHVPLFHKVYAGNISDATTFQSVAEELRQLYANLARDCQHITLVFDKGNNSAEAFERVEASAFHFVGSLVPTQHMDLLQVPLRKYAPLSGTRLKDCLAYRTRKVVFGHERTVVVAYNENLLHGQLQGLNSNLEKTRRRLAEIQQVLRRRQQGRVKGGQKPTIASVKRQVQQALTRQWMKGLFCWKIGQEAGLPTLSYRTDAIALARFMQTHLGKTILFTDNDDWSNEDVILAYRSQYHIEHAFRDMKHPHYLGWSPMHHWTDSKIRVHAFTCVLALTLTALLQRTLHEKGIDLSMPRMYGLLGAIRETLVIYPRRPGEHQHPTVACHSTLTAEQQKLFDALNLQHHLPPPSRSSSE